MAHIGESPQLYFNRFYTGWMTQRNPLAVPIRVFGRRIIELYDAIFDGQNMELNNFLKLQRAPGFIQYSATTFSGIPQNFYSFKQSSTGTIYPIVDTSTNVYYAPQGSAPTSLVSKTPPTETTFKGIGPYLYMGNSAFSKKWDGSTVTNWGIAIGSGSGGSSQANAGTGADVSQPPAGVSWTNPGNVVGAIGHGAPDYATVTLTPGGGATSQGPNNCGTGTDGSGNWVNPNNVASSGQHTTQSLIGNAGSSELSVTNFGFNIPAGASITGIAMTFLTSGSGLNIADNGIFLQTGSDVGTDHSLATSQTWAGVTTRTYGSSSDLWGTTWTPAQINASNFGVGISAQNLGSGTRVAQINAFVTITVYYTQNNPAYSDYLEATNYGFAVGGSVTVQGFQVAISAKGPAAGATLYVALIQSGSIVGNWKSIPLNTSGVAQTNTFGNSSDLWGAAGWTPTVVNASNFGVAMYCLAAAGSVGGAFGINAAQVTVFTTTAPVATVSGSAGTMSAVTGYQYVYCYWNSVTGHLSSPSTVSNNTGAFTSKASVGLTVIASSDSQVTNIRVFRTTDGGPGNQFFELPNSPFANTTTSITDTATDGALGLVQAPQPLVNNPPPAGLVAMEWYAGRLWGLVGNLLYFSTGPDTTIGNPQECWAPGYVFPLPSAGVRLKAIPSGMLVWTVDGVHIVQGTSTPSFTVNEFYPDIGIRQYNAFDTDGTNIYCFTSDRQFLQINANGVTEIGANIGDKLDTLDPTLVYISAHRSGSQDQNLFISDGSSTLYSYNLRQQAWNPPRKPVGGCNAIGSIEILPGVYKFLLGATTGSQVILQRDLATFTDNGSTYTPFVTFGNFQLADPGALAQMQAIALEYSNVGAQPTVAILPNEISGTFIPLINPENEPPELQASTSYSSKRWYLKYSPVAENMKHFQLKITFAAAATKDELAGVGMWGNLATSGVTATRPLPQIQGR